MVDFFVGVFTILFFYIVTLVFIVIVSKRKSEDDVGRFRDMKRVYKYEAYDEIINRCKEMSQDGEITYFSVADLEGMAKELKANIK